MLHAPALLDVLEAAEVSGGYSGIAWRAVVGSRSAFTPNSRGARWNPPGVDTLYCALSPAGAEVELKSMLARQPVPITKEIRVAALEVRIEQVLDLRGERCLESAGIETGDLIDENWGRVQPIGAAAAWLGAGAILVPSARHNDGNLVVFVSELGPLDTIVEK